MDAELIVDARAELGEGPAWSARAGRLYWVDIHAGLLHTFAPEDGAHAVFAVGEPMGCVAPAKSGGVVAALKSGFARIDPLEKTVVALAPVEKNLPGNRFNDGKCDPAGRFIAGTMDDAEEQASGSLYSLAPDGTLKRLLSDLRVPNGLAWSPDYKIFYFIDTPSREITAFDYDLSSGGIGNPRQAVRIPAELGFPDGMTSDEEGMLWVGMWGGASVTRWNPLTGEMLARISVPALKVTSCVFGGDGLADLYVTSARKGMSEEEAALYPHAGGLFRLRPGVRGAPTFEFGDTA